MTEYSAVSIQHPDPETVDIRIRPADADDSTAESRQYGSGSETVRYNTISSIYGVRSILQDELVWLHDFNYYKHRLRSRPRDGNSIFVEIIEDRHEAIESVVVDKSEFCRTLVTAAESWYEQTCQNEDYSPEYENNIPDLCDCTALRVGIEEGRRQVDYFEDHETLEGYTPQLQREDLKTIVTDCWYVDRLRELVPQTDAMQSFVDDLAASDDDDCVRQWYDELLSFADPEIPSEAVKALVENPDPRAKDALLHTRWKFHPEVVPHAFRALAKLGGDDVKIALLDYIDVADKAPIRKATIETLGSFEGEEVRDTLREVANDESEDEEIRRVARESLAELGG